MRTCQKKKFDSKESASQRMKEIKAGEGDPKKSGALLLKRVYFCKDCNAWHLTSMSNREKQTIDAKHKLFKNDKYGSIAAEFSKKNGWNKEKK